MISQNNKKGLRNPWLLGLMGLIIVVLGVNAVFIWLATHNRSALVDRDYSTRSRKSNAAVVSDLREQKALAWKASVKQPKAIVTGTPATYEIGVVDRDGAPVSGSVEVAAYRSADESKDFSTAFREVSPGNYQGYISFPLKGSWELRIRVKRGNETFEVGTDKFTVAAAP